ncbi:MAG TPA: iron-sulfur cluster insertion protein ErpA [Geminicoccus sp.]|jgi:iron-sulfur cluster insertion protein|uniref:iron-sulfur cluster insertion protein ErpA n=1 Tax=Geminicoccus sp. TaxID=2024832 RepID=UPI002E340B26|nr:iron-sulfur cluster insertion protein ErpA [Geminicoccus sp.]HEX2529168.1 iron-sulfur cluster insertion protein ErpA [Geminicoccus sp.]
MSQPNPRPEPFQVSERAARRIRTILEREGLGEGHLRVGVSGGGCSGFKYEFALGTNGEPDDIVIQKQDAKVVIDGMSLLYLIGSELDFVEDLNGSYFQVRNPNATSSCGCGTSFAM